jgi:hypothetical protein
MRFAFLAASGAAALMIAAPAFADTASTDVKVSGTVGAQCGVGHQSGTGTRSIPEAVTLTDIVDGNGQLDTTTVTPIAFDNVWCNAANTLTMDVTSLKLQHPPASWDTSSFVAAVDMNVGSDGTHRILPIYFGIPSLQSADATDGIKTVSIGAFETGTLTFSEALITLKMPSDAHSPGVRPLAGNYEGTVTVTATPN